MNLKLACLLVLVGLLSTSLAADTRIMVLEVYPPEAEIRAFFPNSPGTGDGLPNGKEVSLPERVLTLPIRIEAEGFETREEELRLVTASAVSPNRWQYQISLRPESPSAFLRSQWHHHPVRSGLGVAVCTLLAGLALYLVRRQLKSARAQAEGIRNAADQEVDKLKQQLVEGNFELEGETVDDYHIVRTLGEGTYSRVYLVTHNDWKDKFALKLLKQDAVDKEMVARTHREIQVGMGLNHPNLVKLFGFGTFRGSPYIVSEFVPGRPLDEILHEVKRLPVARACRIAEQLIMGLEHAHSAGVIHRDIKPGNLFVTPDDQLKILDFGLARMIETDQKLTATGHALGTPVYMSPDQMKGKTTPASDYYSAGVVIFEMLTGSVPFPGDNTMQILSAHAFRQPPRLNEIDPELPKELSDLVAALLIKKPNRRLTDPDAIIQTLAVYQNLE